MGGFACLRVPVKGGVEWQVSLVDRRRRSDIHKIAGRLDRLRAVIGETDIQQDAVAMRLFNGPGQSEFFRNREPVRLVAHAEHIVAALDAHGVGEIGPLLRLFAHRADGQQPELVESDIAPGLAGVAGQFRARDATAQVGKTITRLGASRLGELLRHFCLGGRWGGSRSRWNHRCALRGCCNCRTGRRRNGGLGPVAALAA